MAQTIEGARKGFARRAGITLEQFDAKIAQGLKRCTRCKEWQSVNSFGADRSRHDGKSATCFTCRRVKERKCTKGRISTFKGHSHTEEARKKQSIAKKGKPAPHKAKPKSIEERLKTSASLRSSPKVKRGTEHYAYKHGQHQRDLDQRRTVEYRDWRTAVFTRDSFTCQHCGDKRGGNLQAHHIKGFAEHEQSRFDVDNGVTLCQGCHERVHLKPIPMAKCRRKKHPHPIP